METEFHISKFVILPQLYLSSILLSQQKYVFRNTLYSLPFAKILPRFLNGDYCLFFITSSCFQSPHKTGVIVNMDFGSNNRQGWDHISLYKHPVKNFCYPAFILLGAYSQLPPAVFPIIPIVTFHRPFFGFKWASLN